MTLGINYVSPLMQREAEYMRETMRQLALWKKNRNRKLDKIKIITNEIKRARGALMGRRFERSALLSEILATQRLRCPERIMQYMGPLTAGAARTAGMMHSTTYEIINAALRDRGEFPSVSGISISKNLPEIGATVDTCVITPSILTAIVLLNDIYYSEYEGRSFFLVRYARKIDDYHPLILKGTDLEVFRVRGYSTGKRATKFVHEERFFMRLKDRRDIWCFGPAPIKAEASMAKIIASRVLDV